ncbi:DUF4197 domain-containing protein [Flaviaesturariibacter amylovorans]|uniref:DUF4197 domain-containing protein n=1 Tax=Flaviaesturariibacter amylovorans TaxID=1084520 RepID=A0ABP8HJS4_9BACT
MYKYLLAATLSCTALGSCETLQQVAQQYTIPTEAEAAEGIRQALDKGIDRGVTLLHAKDGFFGNSAYKLLLPPEAQRVESTLRQLGMGSMVDRAILQINRAAEEAVVQARPIFGQALRNMSIADAIGILRGGQNSATNFFREKTSAQLVAAFSPIIKNTLTQLNATKYYDELVSIYNGFPTTKQKLNPDLGAYVTDKAVTALFDQVAQEEANIRTNVAARTTDVLRKVFGYAAR